MREINKDAYIENITKVSVKNQEHFLDILSKGDKNRKIAETKLNHNSSRSHSIFKIEIKNTKFFSILNLVDLAGSENVSKANTQGIRFKEGSNINKSLLSLSNVISQLSSKKNSFVNYRDSKLTRLLQNSLSGNSKTMIICTISQNKSNYNETWNTLNFGARAKCIKTTIKVNEVKDKNKLISENTALKSKIKELEKQVNSNSLSPIKNNRKELFKSHNKNITSVKRDISMKHSNIINNISNSEFDSNNETGKLSLLLNEFSQLKNLILKTAKKEDYVTDSNINKFMTDNKAFGFNNNSNFSNFGNFNNNNNVMNTSFNNKYTNPYLQQSSKPALNEFSLLQSNSNCNSVVSTLNSNHYLSSKLSDSAKKIKEESNRINNMIMLSNKKPMETNYNSNIYNSSFNNPYTTNYNSYSNYNSSNSNINMNSYNLQIQYKELKEAYSKQMLQHDIQIKDLKSHLHNTISQNEAALKESEDKIYYLTQEKDSIKTILHSKEKEIFDLYNKIKQMEVSNNIQKETIRKLEQHQQNSKFNNTYSSSMLNEVNENNSILMKELKEKKEEIASLNERINELIEENSSNVVNLERFKNEKIEIETQFKLSKNNSDRISSENRMLRSENESYKNEIHNLKNKKKASNITKTTPMYTLNQNNNKSSVLETPQNSNKSSNNSSSHNSSSTLNSNNTSSTFTNKDYISLKTELKEKEKLIKELTDKLNSNKGLIEDTKDIKNTSSENNVNEELNILKSENKDLQELIDEVFTKMKEMQNELDEKDLEIAELRNNKDSRKNLTYNKSVKCFTNNEKDENMTVENTLGNPSIPKQHSEFTAVSNFSFQEPIPNNNTYSITSKKSNLYSCDQTAIDDCNNDLKLSEDDFVIKENKALMSNNKKSSILNSCLEKTNKSSQQSNSYLSQKRQLSSYKGYLNKKREEICNKGTTKGPGLNNFENIIKNIKPSSFNYGIKK